MSNHDFERLLKVTNVSRETFDRLKLYQDMLVKWQSKINLVGPDTIEECWQRHFIDSLQLMPLMTDAPRRAIDIGTGAGFPGLTLTIAGAGDMHLIESDARKATFLKEVARVTNTSVSIHHQRVESCNIDNVSTIVSRACSSLDQLLSYSEKFVSRETICYFHKGKNYPKELLDAGENWMFDYTIIPSVTDTQGAILKIENLRKK